MGINVWWATLQAQKVGDQAKKLRQIKLWLQDFKADLNNGWQGEEMTTVNSAINNLSGDIYNLSTSLDDLSSDIVVVARKIKAEEDAAKEREKAAKAKAKLT